MNQKKWILGLVLLIVVLVVSSIFYLNNTKLPIDPLKNIVSNEDLVSVDEGKKMVQDYLSIAIPDKKITLNDKLDIWSSLDGLPTAYVFYGKTETGENVYLAIAALKTMRPFLCASNGSPYSEYETILKAQSYKEAKYLYFDSLSCKPFLEITDNENEKTYYLFGSNDFPAVNLVSQKTILETQQTFYEFVSKINKDDFGRESRDIWRKSLSK